MKKTNHYHITTNRTASIIAAIDYLSDKPRREPVQMILKSFIGIPRAVLIRLAHRPLGTLPPMDSEKL
jgi:hypothetical protein